MKLRFAGAAAAIGLAVVLASHSAGAAPDGGNAQISDVHTSPGQVHFVYSVDGLSNGDKLNPASIKVSADGTDVPAKATLSGDSSTPSVSLPTREVVLALDTSGSMAGDGIATARQAATTYAKNLPPDVRLGLVVFSSTPTLLVEPTTDRATVLAALAGVTANGDTALYDGIITAVRAMKKAPPGTERRLVILSDGDDTTSARSLTDAIGALNGSSVAADVVAFRLPGDRTALNQLASSSNGRVLPAASAGDLASAFATAARAFSQQVVVTVDVPAGLSGKAVTLSATMNAGGSTTSAKTDVTLPEATASGAGGAAGLAITPAATSTSKTMLWLLLGLVFLAILTVSGVALWAPATSAERAAKQARLAEVGRYRVVETLGRSAAVAAPVATESNLTKATLSFVDRAVRARGKRQGIVDELDRAGIRIRPEEWAAIQASAIVVGAALLTVLTRSIVGLVLGGLLGIAACRVYVRIKTSRRRAAFEKQLPDMLQLIAGSLRSGFSLNQAIAGVVAEGSEPTASEFARALTEVRLGANLEDALDQVADRMKCLDLHLVVMAVRISREVGGNLAEVLLTTVGTMRERAQLRGQVQVLSAEGRLSAKILIGLPFLLGGYLAAFKPNYLRPLYSTGQGVLLLIVGSILLLLGSFWLSRLVKIEV